MLLLFLQTWFIEGLAAPCRITGGSMALTLLGNHRDVICADCGFAFSCDAAALTPGRAICPNCGCANNGLDLLPDLDGDRLLIDRSAYLFRRPRRWEIAAFRHPREASKIVIKRVAGLPGESVQIQNGDVFINGQIQRKTLDCQRSMALMVYDANYSTTVTPGRPALPPRWPQLKKMTIFLSIGSSIIIGGECRTRRAKFKNARLPTSWHTIKACRAARKTCMPYTILCSHFA
ncbi:MAG: signal peptidase I [Thermoguttaceae bacterium]